MNKEVKEIIGAIGPSLFSIFSLPSATNLARLDSFHDWLAQISFLQYLPVLS